MTRDALFLLALTVYQEARGEPYQGKLAVAYVIVNRATPPKTVSSVVFAPYQFSCWNTNSPTRQSVDVKEDDNVWQDCYKAACAAVFRLVNDPTNGATFYLNPKGVTKMPEWYNKSKVKVVIGRHEFL